MPPSLLHRPEAISRNASQIVRQDQEAFLFAVVSASAMVQCATVLIHMATVALVHLPEGPPIAIMTWR